MLLDISAKKKMDRRAKLFLKYLLLLILLNILWGYVINLTDDVRNSNKKYLHSYDFPTESGKNNVGASTSRTRNHCNLHDFCVGEETANLIYKRIFWSDLFESYVPKGLSFEKSMEIVRNIRDQVVHVAQRGSVKMCGVRSNNAMATLADGTNVCVRHRGQRNLNEVLAFYLSRMLKMDNLPEVVLAKVDSSSDLWKNMNISALSWKNYGHVAMIRQIPDVTLSVYIPQIIADAYRSNATINRISIASHTWNSSDLVDLIQWGTMIIFDYLSGQHDRLHFWERTQRSEHMFIRHQPNTAKSSSGKLWLIDNEMAFYVLSDYQVRMQSIQYEFLKSLCVFQYSLISALWELFAQPRPFQALWNYARSNEPLLERNHYLTYFKEYAKQFDQRLANIMQWVQYCDNSTKT